MEDISLFDRSAENAFRHATRLRQMMHEMRNSPDPQLRAYYQEMHDLVTDLATVRNAAALLKL
jgi:hypothetical protein